MLRAIKISTVIVLMGALLLPSSRTAAQQMLKIRGSDTMAPLAQALAETYMKKNPNVMLSVTGGGSGVGLASLINGFCDIAVASRDARAREIQSARSKNIRLVRTQVAKDGITIVVHPSNPIKSLSLDQLRQIYSGAHNWRQFGGPDRDIVACGRDSSSGTYGFFQERILRGRPYRNDMLTLASNNAICQTVSQDQGAIGYVGLAFAKSFGDKVKMIPLSDGRRDPVMSSEDSVAKGTYPLYRYLNIYTGGNPTGAAKAYIDFALSPEGQAIAEKSDYVRLK